MTTKNITLDIQSLMEGRASTYGLLSRIFRVEVDEKFLESLKEMKYPKNTGNKNVDEGYACIKNYLGELHDEILQDLAVDYTRTFIGAGIDGYSAAYPYESVHTSPKRLLMQDARNEVQGIYKAAGVEKPKNLNIGEDHIAFELEFMQILAERTSRALQKNDIQAAKNHLLEQYNFLHDHLLNWTPFFTNDIQRFSKSDFYKGAGKLLEGYLQTEEDLLDELVEVESE